MATAKKAPRSGVRPARTDAPRRAARAPLHHAPPSADLRATFAALKNVLGRHARHLQVMFDEPDEYTLNTRKPAQDGKPIAFGSVQLRASHVAYQLTPMQFDAALGAAISPALRKHQQGRRGFSFTALEPALLEELDLLTRAAMASFTRKGFA
jgi:hypothetical protein